MSTKQSTTGQTHAFRVLWERDDMLVIDKPSGISLLADRSGADNLWDGLKARFGKLYLVHRLDKGTSGALLIARTQERQSALTRSFAARDIDKYYIAAITGRIDESTKRIDLPLCKGRKSRYRVAGQREHIQLQDGVYSVQSDRPGVDAQTWVRPLAGASKNLLLAKPITGRTHQLRVHLSWIGLPIEGDHLYGPKGNAEHAPRLMLHCHKLVVPKVGCFKSPLPAEFNR